ncbi:lytic transglycosylase domain-containing protein [Aquabacterium sp. J223]|uniref:lytic transglycosylase domain-containing protein n=1 Tax=Aquabacterium sp. J223 TaxID=2898431 RepID=UPI0021AE08C3|nr:lytic transglycosylase domain-containing protein [Aquabacterium sp. J223]UUX94596.1 lytic transglycosylase domain-containing protein [Aquabacterium sp. J223]
MTALRLLSLWVVAVGTGIGVFVRDVGHGLLEVGHNTLAVVGLTVVALLAFTAGRDDLRHSAEEMAYGWLQARQEAKAERNGDLLFALAENSAVTRATAADPRALSRQQAAVAQWLSRRYQVAPEPLSRLVQEAWRVGQKANLEPTLILAVMAIESRFNPFAQSPVGAQGLMQVMTRVHDDKYQPFGGKHAAFDPVTNLRVGVQVLKDCIARAGSLEGGLRHYVGAAGLPDDGGYGGKVLAEQGYLQRVAAGKSVPVTAPLPTFVKADPPAPRDGTPAVPAADERVALLDR